MKDRFGNEIYRGSFVRLLDASKLHTSNPEYCGGVYMVEDLKPAGKYRGLDIVKLLDIPGLWTVGCIDSVVYGFQEESDDICEIDVAELFEV